MHAYRGLRILSLVRGLLAHITGRVDSLMKQPGFVIKPEWICKAIGALEADGQFPTLPRTHRGLPGVPVQTDAPDVPAQLGVAWRFFYNQFKAGGVLQFLGQPVDASDYLDVLSLELGRQAMLQLQPGPPTGPGDPQYQSCQNR